MPPCPSVKGGEAFPNLGSLEFPTFGTELVGHHAAFFPPSSSDVVVPPKLAFFFSLSR